MTQHQDNQVGGFIKSAKPVRGNKEPSRKQTHNRRNGFAAKRNQAGFTLIELIQVLGTGVFTVAVFTILWYIGKAIANFI